MSTPDKVREILRCSFDLNLSNTAVAKATTSSAHTVAKIVSRAKQANLKWPLDPNMSDSALKEIIYPTKAGRNTTKEKVMPDFALVSQQLKAKHMTRYLGWHKYCDLNGDAAYSYSYFTIKLAEFINSSAISMHLVHEPAKVAFIDYCGMTIPIYNKKSGQIDFHAQILVVTLAYSGYSYIEAQQSQSSENFIGGIVRCFEFFGGTPTILTPDNLAAAVEFHPLVQLRLENAHYSYSSSAK